MKSYIATTNIDLGDMKVPSGSRFTPRSEAEESMLKRLACIEPAPSLTAEALVLDTAQEDAEAERAAALARLGGEDVEEGHEGDDGQGEVEVVTPEVDLSLGEPVAPPKKRGRPSRAAQAAAQEAADDGEGVI